MLKEIVLSLMIAFATSEESKVPFYRKDYAFSKELNAFYKEHRVALSWSDALATCRAEGASLFAPDTLDEARTIIALLSNNTSGIWLGVHDRFAEGVFVTLEGVPIHNTYSNWWQNEPDDGINSVTEGEDCVSMSRDGYYHDNNCYKKRKFLCLRNDLNVTWNKVCDTHDSAYTYSAETNKCYKLHTKKTSWRTAFRICNAESSKLAIIRNHSEVRLLIERFSAFSRSAFPEKTVIHVGFNDLLVPEVYLTNDGDSLEDSGYNEWIPGQPDDRDNTENCGCIDVYGYYNDVDCEKRGYYFCEKSVSTN